MAIRGNWKRLRALLPVLLLFVWSPARVAVQKPPTKISFLTNYIFHGRHAPFFVGLDKGFYREAGFDINILPTTGSAFVISALEGGKADYGMADSASVVQGVTKGANIKGFAVFMDVSTSGLASLTPYPTPRAVAGKTIAASLTDSARVILPVVFSRAGLEPAALNWLASEPSIYFSLLLSGRAELITASRDGDMPALRRVAQPRGRTVYFASFADWGYDAFGYLLVTQADRIASKPEEVRAFAAATVRAVKYAADEPEEAARIMVRYNPTLDYDTALAHWREALNAINTPFVRQHGYGNATLERLQETIALVNEAFNFDTPPAPSDIYAADFVPR